MGSLRLCSLCGAPKIRRASQPGWRCPPCDKTYHRQAREYENPALATLELEPRTAEDEREVERRVRLYQERFERILGAFGVDAEWAEMPVEVSIFRATG